MASIHQKLLVITSICLCLLVAFCNGGTNSTLPTTSNTTSTNTTSANATSSNTTSTNATSSNTTSTNSTGTGTSNTTSTAAANTTSSNTTSSNTTSSNVTASNTTSTNKNATSNTTSTAASNTTASNTTASNTTAANTTASNTTASNTTVSNTTAGNTTASNTTASNTTASNTTAANTTASNTTASNTTASNTTASNTTASNTTASNTTASNTTASNTTASNTTASNTTASNSTSSNATSSNTTSTNSTASNGTAVSPTSAPITTPTKTAAVKVKVDQTSIQGTALVIGVIKENLTAVAAYSDITKTENRNFVNAAPKLNEKLKNSTVGGQIIGNLTFDNIVAIDTSTVRAEYMTEISKGIASDPIFGTLNGLDQKTIFGTTDLKYKVDFVPLTVKNRWHDGKVRLPSESHRPSLRDPDSEDFKKFKNVFETLLREQLLRSVPVVRQVVIKDVLQGSIIVPFAVETNENSTNTTTQSLKSALDTVTSIGDYTVDPSEDSKSMTGSMYISGLQRLDPIPKDQLPAIAIPTRDGEDIKSGMVSLEEKNKAPVRKSNYFLTVTVPSFAGLLFGIIIFLCCTATATRMMNNNTKNVP